MKSFPCAWIVTLSRSKVSISLKFSRKKAFCAPNDYSVAAACCPTLDVAGVATFLADRTMTLGRKNRRICRPKIGVTDCTLAIDGRQRCPQSACGRFLLCANRHSDDLACIAVECQIHFWCCFLPTNDHSSSHSRIKTPFFAP